MRFVMSLVVTHSRQFHSDEIMAIMLLKKYYFEESPKIIRTRDEKLLNQYKKDENVFVIDVGFVHDAGLLNFDHHQQGFSQKWEDGTPLSSCGLIWKWLRSNKYLHQKMNDVMMDTIENEIIKKVDAQDNGCGVWQEGIMLSQFNRNHHDDKVIDGQFKRALATAFSIYENSFYHLKAKIRDRKDIFKAIKDSDSKGYEHTVVFKSKLNDGVGVVADETKANWVIIPRTKNSWKIQAVPKNSRESFSQRNTPPKEWFGLNDKDLKRVSGINQLFFCHKNGFMLLFEGELKDAVLLTEGLLR